MGTILGSHGLALSPAAASTALHNLLQSTPVTARDASTGTGSTPSTTGASNGSTASSPTDDNSSTSDTPPISEADFMQILVTQLENQDPMNPLQPDQLASELAQFTSVQELAQLNTDATSQLTAVSDNTQAVEANMATALIGRPVIATGGEVDVSSSSNTTSVLADVGGTGQGVLTLTNAQGQAVATYNLGTLNAGNQQVLSFNTKGVTPGPYNYSLTVTGASGSSIPVTTYITGTVTGVNVTTGTPTLDIGDLTAPITNLVEVLPTSSSSGTH
jgi:flagellar basal-body rod modification protein FlgD